MQPICKAVVPAQKGFQFIGVPEKDKKAYVKALAIIKMLATNAKLAAKAFIEKRLSEFDPIVHENSCQIRALFMILSAGSEALLKEAAELYAAAVKVEQAIGGLMNKAAPGKSLTIEEMMTGPLALQASPGMIYLLQAYFLTVGKIFRMNRDGSETATIEYQQLAHKLSKQIDTETLKEIVDFCQARLAEASIAFIQSVDRDPQLQDVRMVLPQPKLGNLARPCSRSFYNFKAILLKIQADNILILVKQYAFKGVAKTLGVYYQGIKPLMDRETAVLDPKAPVFVMEGFFVEGLNLDPFIQRIALREHINDITLMELALANVAQVKQFSSQDEVTPEIAEYRAKGKKLGCNVEKPGAFTIVHTHAASVGEERARLL